MKGLKSNILEAAGSGVGIAKLLGTAECKGMESNVGRAQRRTCLPATEKTGRIIYRRAPTISPRLAPDLWGDGGGDREGVDKGMLDVSILIEGRAEEVDFEASSALSLRSLSDAADSCAFSVSISETSSLSEGLS
jgi:hypothetical protein